MNPNELRPFLVLEKNLIEVVRPAVQRTSRLHAALRLVRRQIVRRHEVRVVHTPHDERAIRIPFEKIDNDLLADARDLNESPLLARPCAGNTNPTRAVLVLLALTVPVE